MCAKNMYICIFEKIYIKKGITDANMLIIGI